MPLEPRLPETVCVVTSHLARVARVESSRLFSTWLISYRGSTAPKNLVALRLSSSMPQHVLLPSTQRRWHPCNNNHGGSESGGAAGIQVFLESEPPYGSLNADPSWYVVLQAI